MITCDELFSVWTLDAELKREKQRCLDLKILAESTTKYLDGMPRSNNVASKVEKFALAITECKNKINSLAEQILQQKIFLTTKLQSFGLPDIQRRILNYHYVATLPFKAIAKLLHYTTRHVNNLHEKAIKALGLSDEEIASFKISKHFL